MRYSAAEKHEIIRLVEQSSLSVRQTLARLDIHRCTYYNWLKRYYDGEFDVLADGPPQPILVWNQLPAPHRAALVELALDQPALLHRYYLPSELQQHIQRFVS